MGNYLEIKIDIHEEQIIPRYINLPDYGSWFIE